MVPIAIFCFALASIGLLGINIWYCRALANARSDAETYWALAQSWQKTAALAIDAMDQSHRKSLAALKPVGRDILDSIFALE
jgi:hypothetical protein